MGDSTLFEDIMEGLESFKAHQQGKRTLRTFQVEPKPLPKLSGAQIRDIREAMGVSRAVFAYQLRVSTRTLENWEQGRARPNDQAIALILMTAKYPDTLERLRAI